MKNALRKSTRATRPTLSVVRLEDAPQFVALEHRAIAATSLDDADTRGAEWIVERVRTAVPSPTHDGYALRLSLTFTDGDGKMPDVRMSIASNEDGATSDLTPQAFRRLVAALNAAAAALPAE